MIELLEQQKKLTVNQWKLICTANLADLLDFFDFFLIGYVTAALTKQWSLTYWEGGGILLASGLGGATALVRDGSFFYVAYADGAGSYVARIPYAGVADGGAGAIVWQGPLSNVPSIATDATSLYLVDGNQVLRVTPK